MRNRARAGRGHRVLALLSCMALSWGAGGASSGDGPEAAAAMIRRVLTAPEATARVTIERSDPFGGSPARERGRVWFLPGRGLRYRSLEKGGQDVVIDRSKDSFNTGPG